ncbi:Ubiquitin carboxyl-terminal hydrolase family protein, partial [Aphelenchoides avenae]
NADEVHDSADAMEITDLSLEEIQRLPETHQLCKAVKRRLLDKFKHTAKMEMIMKKPSNAASSMAESWGSSGIDYAQLSSDDASEQAQTVQTEDHQHRTALADANHAKLVLHAQNEQLQADLLASQNAVAANEQEKGQLRLEKRRLETEKTALHLKFESDASLVAEREQQAALAEKKVQKLQSENDKLRETLADKERANLDQREQINQLESNLREKQTVVDENGRHWSQLCVANERLVAANANLRRRITELEASTSSSSSGKRQETEEWDGVSAKRGKTERGTTSTGIEYLLQSVLSSDRTMREGFFKSVLLSQDLIFKLLVDAPTSETRESFVRVLFHFLQEAREDDLSTVDLSSMGLNMTFFRDDRTITDSVLRLLTLVPRNHFEDFLCQPQHFFDLVMSWRKRFINVGGLGILLTVIAREEDHRTRSLCCKFPVIFDIVYLLLAACCITPDQEASASAAVMPDARNVFVFAPPSEVHEWITDADNGQRLIRMLLQYAYENSTVRNTICMLCRDNMITTKRVFAHLHSKRLMMLLEQRNFLNAFRELMTLKDGYQRQRIVLGVHGSTDGIKGFMQDFLGMRYRHTQPGKAVQLLDEFTLMYEGEQAMQDVLSKDNDFATAFHEMTEWLSRQVDAKDQQGLSYRFDDVDDDDWTMVIDKEQAVEVFGRCKLICDHFRSAGSFQLMQEPTEFMDTEKDEGVRMDDVADAN